MTRVHRHQGRHGATSTGVSTHHKRTESKKKPSYKVVLEEVTGKKKLKTLLSFRAQAPPGYMFIPAGDPQLTSRCKKIAKDEQLTVYIVSTSRHPHEKMSREVHRIGYHFPSFVVEQACMTLGVTLTASGRVLQSRFAFVDEQTSQQSQTGRVSKKKSKGKRRNASPSFDMTLSQAIIDTQAREAIKDLFPKIPAEDLHTIIGRAFQKGKGLVGTVSDLSLVRRAQLAVTAHIRHEYTNYDRFLKTMDWAEARNEVQQACLDMLVQWRGDDDDDGELEDILREVIVISDDEDDEEEMQQGLASFRGNQKMSGSVGLLSSNAVETQSVNYANVKLRPRQGRSTSPEDEDSDLECLGAAPTFHHRKLGYNRYRLEEIGAHRQRLWDDAVNRQQKHPRLQASEYDRPRAPGFAKSSQAPLPPLSTDGRGTGLNSYDMARTGQNRLPRQVDQRLVPLVPDHRTDNRVQSGHSENLARSANQVFYVSHERDRAPQRAREELKEIHYRNKPEPYDYSPIYHSNQPSAGNVVQHTRLVSHPELRYEKDLTLHGTPAKVPHQPYPDFVLPSIEGGKTDEQVFFHDHLQREDMFASQGDGRSALQRAPPPTIHVSGNVERSHLKERRVDKQVLRDERQPSTNLGQTYREENHPDENPRAAANGLYDHALPYTHDPRIIQLPPKEVRKHGEMREQRPYPMLKHGQCEDHSDHESLYQQTMQPRSRYISAEAGYLQSHRNPAVLRPVAEHKSFNSPNVFDPMCVEDRGPPSLPQHAYRVQLSGRSYTDTHPTKLPQRAEQQGEMQRTSRGLAINATSGRNEGYRALENERDNCLSSRPIAMGHLPSSIDQGQQYKAHPSQCLQQQQLHADTSWCDDQHLITDPRNLPHRLRTEAAEHDPRPSMLASRCERQGKRVMSSADAPIREPGPRGWEMPFRPTSPDDQNLRPNNHDYVDASYDRRKLPKEVVVLD